MPAQLRELVAPLLHMARSWKEGTVITIIIIPSGTSSIPPILVFVAADPCQDHSCHSASSGQERCMSAPSEDALRVMPQCFNFFLFREQEMKMYGQLQ